MAENSTAEQSVREFQFLSALRKHLSRSPTPNIEESREQLALDSELVNRMQVLEARIQAAEKKAGAADNKSGGRRKGKTTKKKARRKK